MSLSKIEQFLSRCDRTILAGAHTKAAAAMPEHPAAPLKAAPLPNCRRIEIAPHHSISSIISHRARMHIYPKPNCARVR
jgi:hypothetical protein